MRSGFASPPLVVAMSGGVDSSTVAAMLQSEGTPLVGLTMQLWNQRRLGGTPAPGSGRCCSLDDVHDARRVAEFLSIPHYVVNLEERFEQDVVANFVHQYRSGRTPVPCSHCNTAIKFGQLLDTARQIGADRIATGHYARVTFNSATGRHELRRAMDANKDQTFFLWGLDQEQLGRAVFPLGALTKTEVRRRAEELHLSVADKPDSHEICFVPGGDYTEFLSAYAAERGEPLPEASGGDMVAPDGSRLGTHDGIHRFTVGQRKGLGLATGNALYVLRVEPDTRRVVVGGEAGLYHARLLASGCHWISGEAPAEPVRVTARIRHRHSPASAWAEPLPEGRLRVCFDQPQRAITPGQAVVLYQDDLVLGGAWIDSGEASG